MNLNVILLLLWKIWTDAPSCGGSCQQGRKACDCGVKGGKI